MSPKVQPKAQRGATLIEVLVTMLVVAIGLLGAAGMQLAATRYQQTAHMRSQAIVEAEYIAEKIRANINAVVAVAPPLPENTYIAPDAYAAATLNALAADPACGLAAQVACTFAQAALKDMRDWRRSLQALPGGRGSILPVTGVGGATDPAARQVVVMWQEKQHKLGGINNHNPVPSSIASLLVLLNGNCRV